MITKGNIKEKNIPFERENIPFNRLFSPRAIVIIGVSTKSRWGGSHYLETLKEYKYPGSVYPVNPKYEGEEVQGFKIYGSITSLPDDPPIDLGIVAIPAKFTPQTIKELGQKGALFAHIFSSGFSELGEEGKKLEKDLLENAKKSHIRILGPNCMGIYSPKGRMGFTHNLSLKEGLVAFVSQSGGLASMHSHIGIFGGYNFSKVISLGNQIDLDLVDFLDYFRTDPDTKIISMYVENLKRSGNRFIQLLKETTKVKPVIIWKGGKLKAGHSAVRSHTGGLAGNIQLWKAMARQTGTILVNNFPELVEMIQTCLICKIPENLGTAIITGGGGPAVEMTDECEAYGLQVPRITKQAQEMINKFVPEVNSNLTNPLEFGANGSQENMIKTIEVVDKEPHISTIMITIRPERYKAQGMDIGEVVKTYANAISPESNKNLVNIHRSFGTPTVAVESVQDYYSKARENGIIIYRSVASAAKSVYRLWSYGNYLKNRGYKVNQ
ncbi:MAG: CoA-binding protein [Promethearchaeota archaeon]|jgi:acyl-CoA synthetase (NDP forming)